MARGQKKRRRMTLLRWGHLPHPRTCAVVRKGVSYNSSYGLVIVMLISWLLAKGLRSQWVLVDTKVVGSNYRWWDCNWITFEFHHGAFIARSGSSLGLGCHCSPSPEIWSKAYFYTFVFWYHKNAVVFFRIVFWQNVFLLIYLIFDLLRK